MKKEVQTFEEAEAFVTPLMAEKKWAISVIQKTDGSFMIQWMEHRKYTAYDGKEFFDEVWTTEKGEMKLVQDLEPEHARNILRMILRKEREATEVMQDIFKEMVENYGDGEDFDEDDIDEDGILVEPEKRILH